MNTETKTYTKSFIEEIFPVREVSKESVREKNIRHGHISTLHVWWARRPLAASRATVYASLIPLPDDEPKRNEIRNFIVNLSKWENSNKTNVIEKARKDISEAHEGKVLRVLDPFGGGGSIPLECLRLGLETYTGDYNPVAVLIQKCTLEYPQRYGKPGYIEVEEEQFGKKIKIKKKVDNVLIEEFKKWSKWLIDEVKKEVGRFYPNDPDGSVPIGYIWARTIKCQNPLCNTEIPLMRQFWLARKENKKISLMPKVIDNKVEFEIVGQDNPIPKNFNPDQGTISKAIAKCLVCGSTVDDKTVRKLFQEGKSGQRMVAVILSTERGKKYRLATEKDIEVYKEAEKYLEEKRSQLMEEWGIDPIPDEEITTPCHDIDRLPMYGMKKWGDLFNCRQRLVIISFIEKIRKLCNIMIKDEYAISLISYLSLILSKLITYSSVLTRWRPDTLSYERIFDRQAFPMVWDYGEKNPFMEDKNSWYYQNIIEAISEFSKVSNYAKIYNFSATLLPYNDNYFDAIFTDPPYYDNVGYANLSDFFYVWFKRCIGEIYPDLFSTYLTPKSKEIVADPYRHGSKEKARKFFEENLFLSFREMNRVLKPNGILLVVYTHKSTSGWETLINSLLDAGFVVSATWPIDTEMKTRLNAKDTASLASSIYIVARKIEKEELGWFEEIKNEIKEYLEKKLDRLWKEGLSGADFFIAGIGSAIEIFGKYKRVMDYEGSEIKADKLLEFVRQAVTEYVVKQILSDQFAGVLSSLSRFYILYRWSYGESKVEFDEARKLSQSVGLDIEKVWNRSFIKKEGKEIKVLGPTERRIEDLEKAIEEKNELVDVLHYVLLLIDKGEREKVKEVLLSSGYGNKDIFYKVAQAVSETLSDNSKEKKLIHIFLYLKERLKDEIISVKDETISAKQEKLFS